VAIYLAIYGDFFWLLDKSDQDVVLSGTMDEFEGDTGSYGLVKAEISAARGDLARARAYADTGVRGFEGQLRNKPDDRSGNALLALTLTYLDRKADATAAIERALKAPGGLTDIWYEQDVAARTYLRLGEPEKALDLIETALQGQGPVSRGYYRFNPVFAPLKGHSRFEKLIATSK
jgi:adenylate cyclase